MSRRSVSDQPPNLLYTPPIPLPVPPPRCTDKAGPSERYVRRYSYVGDGKWQPIDLGLRTGLPVSPDDVIVDKCREHGPDVVSKVLGMSQATVTSYGMGGPSLAMTRSVIAMRLPELHELDLAADARKAKAG